MKCQYMDELTGGRGIIFATGTPVSNSMTELYTMMRYLQYGTLQQKGLTHFDSWASTFGETTTAIELAPEGTGYRARTRFAKFFNLPELMNMFKEVADIKTSDQLHLPVPEAKFETVVVQPSEHQQAMVAELSERAAAVHSGVVDPSVDNMLKITSDGRKLGLDQRLMNPLLPDDPNSKLNACVRNVLRIYEEGQSDKLTQLLFCDLSTPKNDGTFNVYEDIRAKLIQSGVPEEEIAFIHDADTEAKKKDLFAKVRTGQVRVLLGSTQKMGAGTNVQDRLVAVHHLDVGWRPADMTQRNGRIIRQGNRNKEVQVYQYVTEGTFDAYLYQTLENKQKFISQIMTSKSPVRSCDDVDEQALSYAEIKALCAGDPQIKEKMDLDVDVARLKVLKADHQSQQYRLEDKLMKYFPAEIEKTQGFIKGFQSDIRTVAAHPLPEEGFCGMEVNGAQFTEKAEAGEAMYLDKPMKDHTLLQAICRTNRTYDQGKTHGLIVDYIGIFDDVARALDFDENSMRKIITNIEEIKKQLPTLLKKCLGYFLGVDRTIEGWEGLMAAQECLPTNKEKDAFAADYRVLNRAWDALSPDVFLNAYKADYQWLSRVYESVKPTDGRGGLIWASLGAKTIELVHQNLTVGEADEDVEILAMDADLIDEFLEKQKDLKKTTKKIEINLVAKIMNHTKDPKFIKLGEKLETLREKHEQGLVTSIEFLKLLLELAKEAAQAEKEVVPEQEVDKGIAALTELFNGLKNRSTPVIVERIVADIDSIVKIVRFDGWQSTTAGKQEVKKALRSVVWIKYKIKDKDVFDKAYSYIEQYY